MGSEYIPGPWNLYRGEDGEVIGVRRYVEGNSGGTVAKDVCTMALPNLRPVHKNMLLTQAEINATGHLIAAAPDLLALCIEIRDWLKPELEKEPDRTYFWKLVDAIKKATTS